MSVLTVIPCRAGSKRLPGKHLRPLTGRPLLDHTVVPALEIPAFGTVLVSTDDAQLATRAVTLGATVPFLRPADLATDQATSADVCLHALDWYRGANGHDPDLMVLMQVTSPFRPWEACRAAIDSLERDPRADAVVAMTEVSVGLDHIHGLTPDGLLRRAVPRRNGMSPIGLVPCGSLYAVRPALFRADPTFVPPRTRALVMDKWAAVDIDTEDDFALAEMVAACWPDLLAEERHHARSQ